MEQSEYLGLELEAAKALLESRGIVYRVNLIAPFYKGRPKPVEEGDFRIIRVKEGEDGPELTACRVPSGAILAGNERSED